MGLDWRPLNKPFAGKEREYENLFFTLSGDRKQKTSFKDRFFGKKEKSHEELLEEFLSISTPAYVTLNAPQVGTDENANEWAKSNFENRSDKSLTLDQFMTSMRGYYVLELVEACDGIPMYIAPHDERHVFRGQFLHDCVHIIGEEMLEEAYTSKLVNESLDFGQRLMQKTDSFAKEYNLEYLKEQRMPPEEYNEKDPKSNTHILYSAAKWILWWGQRGHGYEAYY